MENIIEIKDLHFHYDADADGKVPPDVLKGINLSIKQGEFVAVLGHNGCGKSTLAKHLNGILVPTDGKVIVDGIDTSDENRLFDLRQRAGMVFQNPDNQIVSSIVEEDVAFALENLGVPYEEMRKRVDESLKAVNMYEYRHHSPSQLSGGQKQRVAIAGIIAMQPKCIILDEPTAALTQTEIDELFQIMADLKSKGIGMIYISHRMDEIKAISDRITVMRDGEYVGTLMTKDTTKDEIVKMMVGRVIYAAQKEKSKVAPDAPVVLEVKNIKFSYGKRVLYDNFSISVDSSERVGIIAPSGFGKTQWV